MSITLPISNLGITFQEIPGQISFFIEIGNCIHHCPNCHSPHLQKHTRQVNLAYLLQTAKQSKKRGASAILLMGGTTNQIPLETLRHIIEQLSTILPVGIYSGDSVQSHSTSFLKELPALQWIKVGEYNEKLGGLSSPTTNQRFYQKYNRLQFDGSGFYIGSTPMWEDITAKFQL